MVIRSGAQGASMPLNKHYISPQQLLEDSFRLGWQVFASGYRPTFIIAIWRGGTPVGAALHELLDVLGVTADHFAIRTASYTGIGQRGQRVSVDGLDYLIERVGSEDRVLLVADVHDTGLSLQQVAADLRGACGDRTPDIRVATPYFKPGNNQTGKPPDYFLHETDEWLVFPHELAGLTLAEMRASKPALSGLIDQLEQCLEKG